MKWSVVASFFAIFTLVVVLMAAPKMNSVLNENHRHLHRIERQVQNTLKLTVTEEVGDRYKQSFSALENLGTPSGFYHARYLAYLSLLKFWDLGESCTSEDLFDKMKNDETSKVLIRVMSGLDQKDEGAYLTLDAYENTFSEVFPGYKLSFDEFAIVDYFSILSVEP